MRVMDFDWITIHIDKINTVQEWVGLIFILIIIGGAVWYILNRKKNEANADLSEKTIAILKENNDALAQRITVVEAETKECNERSERDRLASENQHKESMASIHQMKGEIKAYRGLTLIPKEVITNLTTTLQENVKNTGDILSTLEGSAITLAKDTQDAKVAVAGVKTDLQK